MKTKPRKTRKARAFAPRKRKTEVPSPPSDDQIARIIEQALYCRALDGNVSAQVFWLCNRAPERWRSSGRVPLPPPGGPLTFADFMRTALEPEETDSDAVADTV